MFVKTGEKMERKVCLSFNIVFLTYLIYDLFIDCRPTEALTTTFSIRGIN